MNATVFYVLTDAGEGLVKFGITNGDGKTRLAAHRRDGYIRQKLLMTEMPAGMAEDLERAVKRAMKFIEIPPERGEEYFTAEVLSLILMLAEHFPSYWLSGHRGTYAAILFGSGRASFMKYCTA